MKSKISIKILIGSRNTLLYDLDLNVNVTFVEWFNLIDFSWYSFFMYLFIIYTFYATSNFILYFHANLIRFIRFSLFIFVIFDFLTSEIKWRLHSFTFIHSLIHYIAIYGHASFANYQQIIKYTRFKFNVEKMLAIRRIPKNLLS